MIAQQVSKKSKIRALLGFMWQKKLRPQSAMQMAQIMQVDYWVLS